MADGKNCHDCTPYKPDHIQNWITELVETLVHPPFEFLFPKTTYRFDKTIDDVLIKLGLFSLEKNFNIDGIYPATAAFIKTAQRAGLEFQPIKSFARYTGYFRMKIGNKFFDFEKLPRAENSAANKLAHKVDDKWIVKQILQRNGLPVAPGKSFWWFQKNKALKWARSFGYPLIVKPRRGSLSKHVYYDIKNENDLVSALNGVIRYSPVFLIERFLPNLTLYRITAVDCDKFFVAKRSPPKVIGDGSNTVKNLMEKSGISEDKANALMLKRQNLTFDSVTEKGKVVWLHEKIILALGAEFEEEKCGIHDDNFAVFKKIADIFGNKLIGIDFLCEDIDKSWKNQKCAILELNSLPNIRMHTFEEEDGSQRNKVAEALVGLVLKYYN